MFATYSKFNPDLIKNNAEVKVVYGFGVLKTLQQFINEEPNEVYTAINGGKLIGLILRVLRLVGKKNRGGTYYVGFYGEVADLVVVKWVLPDAGGVWR